MMIDYVKYDLKMLLSRNKSLTYQEAILRDGKTLMAFLKENGLITVDPFDESGDIKKDLIVRQSDLTDEGIKLFAGPIKKWWGVLDRGGKPENISLLKKGLDQIRESSS